MDGDPSTEVISDWPIYKVEFQPPSNGSPTKVNLFFEDGRSIQIQLDHPPKTTPEKLFNELVPLLSYTNESEVRTDIPSQPTFGTSKWILDKRGDAIHRFIAVSCQTEAQDVIDKTKMVADEVNHHPHIVSAPAVESDDTGDYVPWYMTITCTSHRPRGLSLRDARLAKRIDEILAEFDVRVPLSLEDNAQISRLIRKQRLSQVETNRTAIDTALSNQPKKSA